MSRSKVIDSSVLKILRKIRLIAFDVDGVLTDGRIYYGAQGECMKVFNSKDGYGIRLARTQGYHLAIITARKSVFVEKRAADWGLKHVFQDIQDKRPVFEALCKELNIDYEQTTYMGDDALDIPVLKLAGFATCPQDAMPIVKKSCHWISKYKGGLGAARELCDLILSARE
ncbi:MAG: HAD-IIIA family hydrolase [Puniceicoccales bacterium]|jgi:3-deoxy-D-manno-octulosonate 8-phosphate phosphatase (KDO 8-P phosphatase)|nr:HAD-IIIA family hydrolase [Puniceicoccales bacterium]